MKTPLIITKELLARFKEESRIPEKVKNTEGYDPIVITHFFHANLNWHWFATEFDAKTGIFFGFVHGFENEWGSFSLQELEENDVQRDIYWEEKVSSKVFNKT